VSHWPPRAIVIAWAALLALLGTTVVLAYQPLGRGNLVVALCIAAAKAAIIAAVFMELRERRSLTIAFAAAGVLWFAILLWLSGIDFVTR
jgi:cytochrome c oxidase subunit 4